MTSFLVILALYYTEGIRVSPSSRDWFGLLPSPQRSESDDFMMLRRRPTFSQKLSPFLNVPADLLLEIAGWLDARIDLLSLCMSVSALLPKSNA